jgi:hypothetical protein
MTAFRVQVGGERHSGEERDQQAAHLHGFLRSLHDDSVDARERPHEGHWSPTART